jgi:hypothetical protein
MVDVGPGSGVAAEVLNIRCGREARCCDEKLHWQVQYHWET